MADTAVNNLNTTVATVTAAAAASGISHVDPPKDLTIHGPSYFFGSAHFHTNPIVYAIFGGHTECLKYIISQTPFSALSNFAELPHLLPLRVAAALGRVEDVRMLMMYGAADPFMPIDETAGEVHCNMISIRLCHTFRRHCNR
jgi:hypothetical protein